MLVDIDGIVKYTDEMFRVHYGTVVSNADPKKIGRIKCTIMDLLDFPVADLPWCYPNNDSPDKLFVPKVGAKVKIILRNGDIYHPEYVGYYHSTENHNPDFDPDYPNTIGVSTDGFKIIYNKIQQLLEVVTPNGSYFKMDKDGNTSFKANKNFSVEATQEATFLGKTKTTVGSSDSQTFVNGTEVIIAEGGLGVAVVGSEVVGTGNLTIPVVSQVTQGSSKVFAPI